MIYSLIYVLKDLNVADGNDVNCVDASGKPWWKCGHTCESNSRMNLTILKQEGYTIKRWVCIRGVQCKGVDNQESRNLGFLWSVNTMSSFFVLH